MLVEYTYVEYIISVWIKILGNVSVSTFVAKCVAIL